jgi:hypothetical protein
VITSDLPSLLAPRKFRKFRKFDTGEAELAAEAASSRRWLAATRVRAAEARQISAAVGLAAAIAVWWLPGGGVGSGAQSSPEALPAEVCIVAPRTGQEIATLLADPNTATPAATTGGQTLPAGEPVTAETTAAMEQVVQMWLACQNAGEPLRAWSLFSDGYLFRLLSRQGGVSGDAYRALATPAPVAAEAALVLAIEGERLLPDGRYGATVTVSYPSVPMPKRFFFYFTQVEGRLLIDGILGEISFSVP